MRIFVARHGETEWNLRHKVCGISEADLTEKGKNQARALAEKLKAKQESSRIGAIIVSPLRRARDTASYIESALGIEAAVENDLHEMNFGAFEGADWDDPEFRAIRKEPFVRFPGGESAVSAAARVYALLDRIRREYSCNVLLICHGTLIKIIDTYFRNRTMEEYSSFRPGNCELITYEITSGESASDSDSL